MRLWKLSACTISLYLSRVTVTYIFGLHITYSAIYTMPASFYYFLGTSNRQQKGDMYDTNPISLNAFKRSLSKKLRKHDLFSNGDRKTQEFCADDNRVLALTANLVSLVEIKSPGYINKGVSDKPSHCRKDAAERSLCFSRFFLAHKNARAFFFVHLFTLFFWSVWENAWNCKPNRCQVYNLGMSSNLKNSENFNFQILPPVHL